MFGDDPNPTVTTNRVGYGTTFGRAGGDYALRKEGLDGHGQEGSEKYDRPETVNESKGRARQLLGDASLKTMTATECRCNANYAMMNATHK